MTESQLNRIADEAAKSDPKGPFTAHYGTYGRMAALAARDGATYEIFEIRVPWWRQKVEASGIHKLTSGYDRDMGNPLKPVGVEKLGYFIDSGFQYAVVNSYRYEKFMNQTPQSRNYPGFSEFYRELFSRGTLIKAFIPENQPGPEVRIFKLPGKAGISGIVSRD
jgi:hypothetical protein